MGDGAAPSVTGSMNRMTTAVEKFLPMWSDLVRGQILPTESAIAEAAMQYSPQYNQLQSDLASQYLDDLYRSQAEASVGTDADMLRNYGAQMASAARAAEQAYDPAYDRVRGQSIDKLGELMGSIDLNNASPEAERMISQENQRSGTANQPSATNTVANALSFGKEMDNRRNQLSQAISVATQFLPSVKAGTFNPSAAILGRGQNNMFMGVQPPSQNSFQMGQDVLNSATQLQNTKVSGDAANQEHVSDYFSVSL